MNKMKKFASIATAVLMTACMAAPMTMSLTSSAASITISGISTEQAHTFEVYQIFTGDLSNGKLSNLKWGSGVTSITNGTTTWTADVNAVPDEVIAYLTSVGGDARQVIGNITLNSTKACADVTSTSDTVLIDSLADGYYVVKDVTNLDGKDDANSAWIVQVADTATVTIKNAKPTVDKQVWDETTDAEEGHTDGWGESADHAINEQFKFKLVATVPANTDADMKAYKSYKLKFNDTMSAGVTFEEIESVTINNGTETITLSSSDYSETATSAANKAGLTWALTIDDVISKLTEDNGGVWGTNDLTVEVIYKAHLNENAVISNADVTSSNTINNNMVNLEYSNNPDNTGTGTSDTGKTPDDYVWVFTYEVDNTKYKNAAGTGNELAGAGFKLYSGANEIGLIYDNTLSAYRPIKADETAEEMMSATNTGKFDIKGLDAGTYTLKETTTPAGYNKCADITIKIGATHKEDASETAVSMTLSNDSTMSNEVINKEGSTLPGTGGIGTTLFYVGGGAMVAVAGVFLITKKRMGRKED